MKPKQLLLILTLCSVARWSIAQSDSVQTQLNDGSSVVLATPDSSTFDSTAVAIDSLDSFDNMQIDSSAIALDMDTNSADAMLFKVLDRRLPYIELEQLNDTIFSLIRTDEQGIDKIRSITGEGTSMTFVLNDSYSTRYKMKRTYTFDYAFEYILDDDIDIIALVSATNPVVYVAYCTPHHCTNHLGYLYEFENNNYRVYEFESQKGSDVAMFNYTLSNINTKSGSAIYPIADLAAEPGKDFWQSFGIAATTAGGCLLAAVLLLLLL